MKLHIALLGLSSLSWTLAVEGVSQCSSHVSVIKASSSLGASQASSIKAVNTSATSKVKSNTVASSAATARSSSRIATGSASSSVASRFTVRASSLAARSTSSIFGSAPQSTVTSSLPTYSTFPLGSVPCFTQPYSTFDTSRAGQALNTVCISSQVVTLSAGGVTKYSGVANGVTAVVELNPGPSCRPGPVELDAERCLNAFQSIENKCPLYGGQFVYNITLGCLKLSLNGGVVD